MFRPFVKMCSFGRDDAGGEDCEAAEPPLVLGSRVETESQELFRQFSSLQEPLVVAPMDAATVNLSALQARDRGPNGASSPVASVGRVKSTMHRQAPGITGLDWTESRKLLEVSIAIEQQSMPARPDLHYRQDVAAQEQRLRARLDNLGLDMYVQRGDGNCQFRSLSFCLHGSPEYHASVRGKAVTYMKLHRGDFEAFLGEEFKGYVREMARNGVWGDELTLRAACEAYGLVVNVISSDAENWFMRYIPAHTLVRHEAFLSYIAPVHYNAVRRRPRRAAPMLRSLSSLGRRNSRVLAALDEYAANRRVPQTPRALMEEAGAA